ncbi:MAG: pseudouridine-5'-phosphate glycosidase [Clostridia bacterium]|nr:pseudouridine-5'-phosphate glycosidase [Clostridia bacterium]
MQTIKISKEVAEALANNRPVVALESTIISHGMPYPQNVQTAKNVEQIVRDNGCVPATVAVIGGTLTIGCNEAEIELLGKKGTQVVKVSRRDLPIVVAQGVDGATTVAGTMYACSLAGIDVFATGGIGGAHRNSQNTMDISADLDELAQTGVTVVCAGAKSILDIGLTLECLETRGVPVIGYKTDDMPAFYTRKSGFKTDYRLDTPLEIAKAHYAKQQLKLKGGMLVVNPVPEQYSMDEDYINANIQTALDEADKQGVSGKQITPFLLDKIQRLTEGKSLQANIQLVYNNVRLACGIASELCKLKQNGANK